MKKRPFSITLIGYAFIILGPILDMVERIWVHDWPLLGPRGVITNMTHADWGLMALMPIVGFGILRVNRWGYFLFLAYSFFSIVQSGATYYLHPSYSVYSAILFSLITLGLVGFFLQKHVMAPYFNPTLKWWERNPRFSVNLAAQVRIGHKLLHCNILDISIGGCFFETSEGLSIGDVIWMRVQLGEFDFTALGKIVWVSRKGMAGAGVKFVGMGVSDKRILRKLIRYLSSSNPYGVKADQGHHQVRAS